MAGKWRLARFCGQLAVESGVRVQTFRGRQRPFTTIVLSDGDLTLIVADPVVLEQLASACWRASDALTQLQPDPLLPDQMPSASVGKVRAESARCGS